MYLYIYIEYANHVHNIMYALPLQIATKNRTTYIHKHGMSHGDTLEQTAGWRINERILCFSYFLKKKLSKKKWQHVDFYLKTTQGISFGIKVNIYFYRCTFSTRFLEYLSRPCIIEAQQTSITITEILILRRRRHHSSTAVRMFRGLTFLAVMSLVVLCP